MSDRLHVLIVDDNPQDRALVIRELRKELAKQKIKCGKLEEEMNNMQMNHALEQGFRDG